MLLKKGNKDVSPVTLINGVGAEAFVEQLSNSQLSQDADARYNTLLANVPINLAGEENEGGLTRFRSFPGVHEFNLTYANGTTTSHPVLALSNIANFTSTTGAELWDEVCAPLPATTDSPSKKLKREEYLTPLLKREGKDHPAPVGYPTPVVKDAFNLLNGYFPESTDLKDVAVMTVASFETAGDGIPDDEIRNFAVQAQTFVNKAVAAGKSKIIIDVTGNGGGVIDSGFGLLSVFFPNMTIFSATRIRSVPETQYIFETASRVAANPDTDPQVIQFFNDFVVQELVKPDQKTGFGNVSDFLGPFYELDVPSTAISASNKFIIGNSTQSPINIFGKGGPLNGTEPPFKPEDIVIVSICYFSS